MSAVDHGVPAGGVDLVQRQYRGYAELHGLDAENDAADEGRRVRHEDYAVVPVLDQALDDHLLVVRIAGYAVRARQVLDDDRMAVPDDGPLVEGDRRPGIIGGYDADSRQTAEKR